MRLFQSDERLQPNCGRALAGNNINKTAVRSLSARYGELDGEISYYYATHFAEVGKTVTSEQRQEMIALRSLDNFICEGAYLYSQPISMPQNIPTDFLFGVGTYNSSKMSSWIQSQQQEAMALEPGFGKSIQGRGEIARGDRSMLPEQMVVTSERMDPIIVKNSVCRLKI
jgi:hypothetical protein